MSPRYNMCAVALEDRLLGKSDDIDTYLVLADELQAAGDPRGELITLQQLATGAPVFVVPVLISKGRVSRDKLPADIAGTPSVYDGEPLLVHDALARWIERRVRSSP